MSDMDDLHREVEAFLKMHAATQKPYVAAVRRALETLVASVNTDWGGDDSPATKGDFAAWQSVAVGAVVDVATTIVEEMERHALINALVVATVVDLFNPAGPTEAKHQEIVNRLTDIKALAAGEDPPTDPAS